MKDSLWEEGGDLPKRLVRYHTVAGWKEKTGSKVKQVHLQYGEKQIVTNAVIVATPYIAQEYDAIVGWNLVEGGMQDGNYCVNETKSEKTVS